MTDDFEIAIVGPCASGKSSLAARLRERGYRARALAQEHSYVPNMWQLLARPAYLIYLDCEPETMNRRQGREDWTPELLIEQRRRLEHARQHADLIIATDTYTLEDILDQVLRVLDPHLSM